MADLRCCVPMYPLGLEEEGWGVWRLGCVELC